MGEFLVIRLPAGTDDAVAWATVDDAGGLTGGPGHGSLAEAAALAPGRRVLVLVPATDVLRARVEVPVKGTAKVLQALPFALEDLLADDVDDLHFAAGPRGEDGRLSAAAVRRSRMDDWITRLRAAGLAPEGLHADADGIAPVPSTAVLLVEDGQVILRDPAGESLAGEPEGLQGLLELWLGQPAGSDATDALPVRNLYIYDATSAGLPGDTWDGYRSRVQSLEVRRLADGALPRLAATVATSPGINLLQGDYQPRSSLAGLWPRWRLTVGLAAGVAVVLLATAVADLWRLKRESAALDQAIAQAFQFTFPGSPAPANARAEFDARVRSLDSGKGGGSQFLEALRSIAAAVRQNADARVQSLNYRSGIIELQVLAPSAETLDKIRQYVADQGKLKAEIESANASGEQIQGRIRIAVGGP